MNATAYPNLRELDHRTNGELSIALLWNPDGNDVILRVEALGRRRFETTVPQELARNAFEHPFAFAPLKTVSSDYDVY